MAALVVLRNKAIKLLLAAAQDLLPSRGAQNPPGAQYAPQHDSHRPGRSFSGAGAGCLNIDNCFFGLRP
jgi:hypothetical protein